MTNFLKQALKHLTGRQADEAARVSGSSRSRTSNRQRGVVLVEALVALAIMGSATTATLASLSSGALTTSRTSLRSTADWIATSEANLINEAAYQATPGTYADVTPPTDFAVTNATSPVVGGDAQIQTVTITVSYQGKVLLTTEILKVDR